MPESPLIAAGAAVEPINAAPLHTNEFFTGMFTQGNPLGPGPVPYLLQKFYQASRYDRLIAGQNVEISPALTLKRRPGHTVLNSATPAGLIDRFYQFRGFNAAGANNRLLTDSSTEVRDRTGATGNTVLAFKATGAGRTAFQAAGNTCYFADGTSDPQKYMLPGKSWQPNTVYQPGDMVADTRGNNQVVVGRLTQSIVCVQVVLSAGLYYAVITFDEPNPPANWPVGTNITFAGLVGYTGLNGMTLAISGAALPFTLSGNQIAVQLTGVSAIYGPTEDVGTATSQPGSTQGQSGATIPAGFSSGGFYSYTDDGNLVWQNFGLGATGLNTYPWGRAAPAAAPAMTAGSTLRQWTPNWSELNLSGSNFYWSIMDSNNNIELAIIAPSAQVNGGPSEPLWSQITPSSTTSAGVTADGTASWTNCGPIRGWVASFAFYQYQCILDTNGNLQYASTAGTTGATQPTWNATVGGTTTDGTVTWTNVGPGTILLTSSRKYAFSYHTISGHVSTASDTVTLNAGNVIGPQGALLASLSGPVPASTDIDQIWIWATAQGGSTLLLLGKIANPTPGAAGTWNFYDEMPDAVLNELITGPIAHANDPPPSGFVPAGFHLGLICGFVNNVLQYSDGPGTVTGNGNESFPPGNTFQLPSIGVGAWSTSMGLIIFRVDGISILLGNNTAQSPLYVVNIFDGVGLASRDAFAVRGNTVYLMTTTGKVLAMNTAQFISAIEGGVSQALPDQEIGFPIGDLLAEFTPADCYVAWLEGPSADSGLFVSDGSTGWYMMRVLQNPEQAQPWSPKATVSGGLSAIAAIETVPGVVRLIAATPSGAIWQRDLTTQTDNGTAYPADATLGSVVLAQPGNTVEVQFLTVEEKKIAGATPVSVAVLFDEISGTFLTLTNIVNDPPNLPAPASINALRFWATQDPETVQICRHMQQKFSWPAENYANELLTNTIYGRLPEKGRR